MCKPLDRKLIVALCELIKKNDERKLIVSNLCKKADISRATFYLHYKNFDEFREALKDYIIDKILNQAFILLLCEDRELKNAVKKENLIFDEYDNILLGYFTSNENCIEFGSKAFLNAEKYLQKLDISESLYEKMISDDKTYTVFFAGYACLVYFGLSDYDETRFRKEMERCRCLFKLIITSDM